MFPLWSNGLCVYERENAAEQTQNNVKTEEKYKQDVCLLLLCGQCNNAKAAVSFLQSYCMWNLLHHLFPVQDSFTSMKCCFLKNVT